MGDNKFISERSHTRIKFRPLTTNCTLRCISEQSPATQSMVVSGGTIRIDPDRSLTPTVIFPDVRAYDPDNVFGRGPANEYLVLDQMQWLVNGEPIEDVWDVNVDYIINTSASDLRGMLTIMKNLLVTEKYVLTFKGSLFDWRTSINYSVQSENDIALTCTDKGEDIIACSVDKPLIEYDPLLDNLLVYDYKTARSLPVNGNRVDYVDDKCYEQTVNVLLTVGVQAQVSLPSGITMRVVRLGTSTALVPNSVSAPELLAATFPIIKFDMRMIAKGDYEVQFMKDGAIVARCAIGLQTNLSKPTYAKPLHSVDLTPEMAIYSNSVVMNLGDRPIQYPEIYYLIKWFTQAQYNDNGTWRYAAVKTWQLGEHISAPIAQLGVGVTYNDSFFDGWFEADEHETAELLLDEEDDVLLDDDGETMLID